MSGRLVGMLTGAALLALAGTAAVLAQSGGFAGNATDPATGYPCLTPFCEAVSLPGTDCVCRKTNPDALRASEVGLVCTVGTGSAQRQCPVEPVRGR